MRKCALLPLSIIVILGACAPPPEIERVLARHALPINERPMYGGIEKNERMKVADQNFIEDVTTKLGRTREEASKQVAQRGFQYWRQEDLSTAMKRFNQAWLLNPKNGEAFWGFAIIVDTRDRNSFEAEKFFSTAVSLLPDDPDLRVDYGRTLGKLKRVDESTSQFMKALELNPKARDANAGLATNFLVQGDLVRAKNHAKIALERGEGKEFSALARLKCFLENDVERLDEPKALSCLK